MIRRLLFVLALALIPGEVRSQTPARFTVQHAIQFREGTDQDRAQLKAVSTAKDIIQDKFLIAREDLNDDGTKEYILLAQSRDECGSGGCSILVLENRGGKAVTLLNNQLVFRPLAVTNEKGGSYRALAVVDDKGLILLGDKRDSPVFGKQLVYSMKAVQAAPPGPAAPAQNGIAAPPAPPAQNLCRGRANCAEVPTFVAMVPDFRMTKVGTTQRIATATVRFANKLTRPLILGYVQSSGVVTDDQGNRYTVEYSGNSVRGIGSIDGDRLDPKFSLSPGENGDARFEFKFLPRNEVLGTRYEIDLTVREIDALSGGQWRLGREYALHFRGFDENGVVAAAGTTSLELATPGGASTPAAPAGRALAPSASVPDPCGTKPRCYAAGPFVAEMTRFITSNQPGRYYARATIGITNLTAQPLILVYLDGSGKLLDDAGNAYKTSDDDSPYLINGIGLSDRSGVDPTFTLAAGETRNVTFESVLWAQQNARRGTTFTYDVTLAQVRVLPSKQLQLGREYAVGFKDLKPATTNFAGDPVAASSGACAAKTRCFAATPFTAEVTQVTTGKKGYDQIMRVTTKITNTTSDPLILAYVDNTGVMIDNLGLRYRTRSAVGGIGIAGKDTVNAQFALNPGESRTATFESNYVITNGSTRLGNRYVYDFDLAQVRMLPSGQVTVASTYAVSFDQLSASLLGGLKESLFDGLKQR